MKKLLFICLLTIVCSTGGYSQIQFDKLATNYATGVHPVSVQHGDLNSDGNMDVVVVNSGSASISVYIGNGNGSFSAKTDYPVSTAPQCLALTDINTDGKLDALIVNADVDAVSVLLGIGNGTFTSQTTYTTGDHPYGIAIGDFNSDTKKDIVSANFLGNSVSVLLGNGNGTFGSKTDFQTGTGPIFVDVGDINGDNILDLAVANQSSDSVTVLIGLGNGQFGSSSNYEIGVKPRSVTLSDINSDNKLDMLATNNTGGSVSVFLGNGNGTFGAKADYTTGTGANMTVIKDFNLDGTLDLAVPNFFTNNISILIGTGSGTFEASENITAGSNPHGMTAFDVNGDSAPDLIVPNYNNDNFSVYINKSVVDTVAPNLFTGALTSESNGTVRLVVGADETLKSLIVSCNNQSISMENKESVYFGSYFIKDSSEIDVNIVGIDLADNSTSLSKHYVVNDLSKAVTYDSYHFSSHDKKSYLLIEKKNIEYPANWIMLAPQLDLLTISSKNVLNVQFQTNTTRLTAKHVIDPNKAGLYLWNETSNAWIQVGKPRIVNNQWILESTLSKYDVKTKKNELYNWHIGVFYTTETNETIPSDFFLSQNYPNPFNPSTTINYFLPHEEYVNLKIYNLFGQEVVTLVSGKQPRGERFAIWDGKNNLGRLVGSGIYIYRIETKHFVQSRKMILKK